MKPRNYSSEGIVLASKRFSEGDRILVIFSKDYGKLSVIAKGVRKPKSKKRGSLEVFSHINFSAARTKSLDIITEVQIINLYKSIRENLKKTTVAYFFVETLGRLTREEEKNEEAFELTLSYFEKLKSEKKLKKLRFDFIYEILTLLGFWPRNKKLNYPDEKLEEVVERKLSSVRVGKKIT